MVTEVEMKQSSYMLCLTHLRFATNIIFNISDTCDILGVK